MKKNKSPRAAFLVPAHLFHFRNRLNALVFLSLLAVSCSEKQDVVSTSAAATGQKQPAAQTSSLVSYQKDTTPAVSTISTSTIKTVVYSIGPLSVQAGDVVSSHLQQELTTSVSPHLMIGCQVVVTDAANSVNPNIGFLNKAATSNLYPTGEGSAEIVTRTGSFKFAAAANDVYINAVFYASSLAVPQNPLSISIPAGPYGELVAVVERGVTRYETNTYPYLPFDSSYGKVYAPATPTVHYTAGPFTIADETMVDVRYQVESTSEQASSSSATHRLGRQIINASAANSTAGTSLLQASQGGIPRYYEHHNTSSHVGGMYFSNPASNTYFNAVVYSKNVLAGDILAVEHAGYGHFVVEMRPYHGFWEDAARNITSVTSTTGQVLYSIGPIDVTAGELYEIRYTGVFAPTALKPFTSKIVRAGSASATTGVTVQPALWRQFGPLYYYTNAIHSTAELIGTSATQQYYNVVVSVPSGGTLPVQDWGELEVVRRQL